MANRIHAAAAAGFAAGAEVYERARPSYPPDAVAAVVEALSLRPGGSLLELGAGTGKMTRLLASTGVGVLAVEPARWYARVRRAGELRAGMPVHVERG